jgi:hypothetical protein
VTQQKRKNYFEAVGLVAIVVSLTFVAYEIRQNTNAVRSEIVQAVSQQSFDGVVLSINNEYLRDAQFASLAGQATERQIEDIDRLYTALMRIQLNRYMQSKIGVIDRETVLELGGRAGIYRFDSFRDYWARSREEYSAGFQEYVERYVTNPESVEP